MLTILIISLIMWIVLIIMNNVCGPWALKCQPSDPPIQDHPTPLFHSSRAIIGRWTLRWRSWQDFSTESFATCTKCPNRCILQILCMYIYIQYIRTCTSISTCTCTCTCTSTSIYIYIYLWKVMNFDHIFDIDISFAYSTRLRSKCHPKSPAHPENGTSNGTLIRATKVCTQANRRWLFWTAVVAPSFNSWGVMMSYTTQWT